MFRLSHIWVCHNICKLLKNYHYEGGHSETITDFLLASSKKNLFCFSYCTFMALKHCTFFSSITSELEYLLNIFSKVTKQNRRWSFSITSHNIFWLEIEGRTKIFTLCISIDIRVFLQVTRRKPKTFAKKVQRIGPAKEEKLWHHQKIAYVSTNYIVLLNVIVSIV